MNLCIWIRSNEDPEEWVTSCGEVAILAKGPPHENRMKFCCFCGAPLREHVWREKDE